MEENTNSTVSENQQQATEELYVFVKFLGHGSFGRVNLYRNSTNNTLVVWKEIDLKRLDPKNRNEAFAEVEILSMLNHPNIISYYKHFIVEDTLYIELEYAKAGTLTSLIQQQRIASTYFDQDTALWYLYQLTSAVDYIHEIGIMHRDIKALNIFFMQSSLLKLGDFGIAKILDPKIGFLESQVGTPFYLSPEIVEGKKYSTKSDIWALGCVAYEILTLSKVFDATNQLKLAIKISTCDVKDIVLEEYSIELRNLVKNILSKEPEFRPSAKEILNHSMFKSREGEFKVRIENLNMASKKNRNIASSGSSNDMGAFNRENSVNNLYQSLSSQQNQIVASKLSEVYIWGGGKIVPKQLDHFKNENAPLHVASGASHYAIITVQKELYTASHIGSNSSAAKLGHDNLVTKIPRQVDGLAGISIEQVSCGDEMTGCVTEDGDLYVFGSNVSGCLGIGQNTTPLEDDNEHENSDSESTSSSPRDPNIRSNPIKLTFFEENNLKVKSISCGDLHFIALTTCNRIFTWGCGEYGRLGHGDEQDRWEPTELLFRIRYKFRNVYAGADYSFLLTNEGRVLAFGNNEFNKMCLNENAVGFRHANDQKSLQDSSNIVYQQLTPKLVKNLSNYSVYKICSGQNHTAVIDEYGRLFTFGSNKFGQLGVGDSKKRTGLNQVVSLVGHYVTNASCGDSFTICSTSENLVFSWGNRKDGRLGLVSDGFDDSTCICTPKPIFGSLHLVSEMSCKHWHSLIIAEKILNSKSMRSISYADYVRGRNSSLGSVSVPNARTSSITTATNDLQKEIDQLINLLPNETEMKKVQVHSNESKIIQSEVKDVEPIRGVQLQRNESTDIPDWLKNDLAEAIYIPMAKDEIQQQVLMQEVVESSPIIENLNDALELISKLKEENARLKDENKNLLEKLKK